MTDFIERTQTYRILRLISDLLDTASQAGCDADLVVVGSHALAQLSDAAGLQHSLTLPEDLE